MEKPRRRSLVLTYIYMATSCAAVGIGILFVVLLVCRHLEVDIFRNLWVLAIPIVLTLVINVGIIELFRKFMRR
jgi:hypothetical protein